MKTKTETFNDLVTQWIVWFPNPLAARSQMDYSNSNLTDSQRVIWTAFAILAMFHLMMNRGKKERGITSKDSDTFSLLLHSCVCGHTRLRAPTLCHCLPLACPLHKPPILPSMTSFWSGSREGKFCLCAQLDNFPLQDFATFSRKCCWTCG